MPLIALLVLALLLSPPAQAAERWLRPVDGAVIGLFTFARATPFAAGARRGVDLRAAPGAPVLAVCSGTVTYSGAVPGRDDGVTIRCGRLLATELGLRSVTVARGSPVMRGALIGRAGGSGVVRLGARVASDRFGWVDPLRLVGAGRSPAPLAPAGPWVRRPAGPIGLPAPLRARAVTAASSQAGPGVPAGVLAGAVLVLAGAGVGAGGRRRRTRRDRSGQAGVPRPAR